MLRSFGGKAAKKFSAVLAVMGACMLPVIHISVNKWRGQHPTVIGSKGGGLTPEMTTTLFVCIATFSFLFISLLMRRYQLEKNQRKLRELKEQFYVIKEDMKQ
jgi:heme exporter protein C